MKYDGFDYGKSGTYNQSAGRKLANKASRGIKPIAKQLIENFKNLRK